MLPSAPEVAHVISQAVAPVFLLAGLGSFLNVCTSRLARIIDRSRSLEPDILASRGAKHDRLIVELRVLDRRMALVSRAIFATVLSAVLTCAVVVLLFASGLTGLNFGTGIALLFIGAMISLATGFAVFLVETRIGAAAVRIRSDLLDHEVEGS
ncbi:DUF2721 domain-containing protein [Sphingomonas ginkgonis]|uniref:DUF2721 domain-containing protein n=1 Tax=Sphingomonas ginkgonis TaxID=2315330 RepID=A0A3R9YP78_9SPHN|nr:DUF2721 domain-containing protein [Sphingomonas ginkgonis]RST31986.1 DUF2721 domain-containing protein [Sphingomonas ginkgonis]